MNHQNSNDDTSSVIGNKRTEISNRDDVLDEILKSIPIVDTHNDFPLQLSSYFDGKVIDADITNLPHEKFQTDITRLKKGRVGAQIWSAYVGCDKVNGYKSEFDKVRDTMKQIDLIKRFTFANSDSFQFATDSKGIKDAFFTQGKLASLIGVEGGHSIDSSIEVLRLYHELGVRYLTLTHTCHTSWADSCTPKEPLHNGLSDFGKGIVKEMARLGMMVDLSHVSHDTMRDAIKVNPAPPFFSHSSSYSICNNTRNVPDDVLLMIKERGEGVVMVNFYNYFVACGPTATLSDVADHIEHISKVAGPQHIGLGGDFDGVGGVLPVGLEDVSKYPDLLLELLGRGFTPEQVKGIAGLNFIRYFENVEQVSAKLQNENAMINEDQLDVEKVCKE